MSGPPIDPPLERTPVRPVLAWVAVALVVAAGVLLIVADGKPQAEVEHWRVVEGTTTARLASSPTPYEMDGAVGDAGSTWDLVRLIPTDAESASDLVLVALVLALLAIAAARTRAVLFGGFVLAVVLAVGLARSYGAGSSLELGHFGQCIMGPGGTCPFDELRNSSGLVVTERWTWRTPQLTMQLVAAGLLLISAGVARAAHRPTPELQPALSDRDVARLLR